MVQFATQLDEIVTGNLAAPARAVAVEEISRGLGPAPSGFVNFRCRHRLGKGQSSILYHHAADQGNEQHAQNTADRHERRRFPIRD